MSEQHTPGRLTRFILDKPLSDIPAYVDQCIKASGGKDFYFLSADCPDKGQVDIAHIGNGPRGEANARRLVACWNACEGLTTEHMENIDMLGETLAGRFEAFHESERELMDVRDELLDVLKASADELARVEEVMLRECGIGVVNRLELIAARAAIAKAESK